MNDDELNRMEGVRWWWSVRFFVAVIVAAFVLAVVIGAGCKAEVQLQIKSKPTPIQATPGMKMEEGKTYSFEGPEGKPPIVLKYPEDFPPSVSWEDEEAVVHPAEKSKED